MLVLVQYAYAFIKLLVSSTLFPSLLTSISQQKHSPNTATNIRTEYDYIVVGAGSGGSVVASRLSEMPCVNILLLEAGKPPPLLTEVPGFARFFWFTDIDWKYRTAPQKYTGNGLIGRQLVWPSGKTLGGSSTLNGMFYVRGNRQNYDRWAAEGADGWSYKDVLPYFIKMEDNRDPEYVANGFHGVKGPQTVHRPRYQPEYKDPLIQSIRDMGYRIVDPNAYRQTGFYDLQSNLRSGQRCSTAKAYLVPAENRPNLDILTDAMVRKVVIKNRQAIGVQFDYQGQTIEVRARREVIMSAGTTNTAQLLMLSGIGPKEELNKFGIPVIADLPVGKNLQDHAGTVVPFSLPLSVQRITEKIVNPANVNQYIQNRTGLLGSSEFISLLAFLQNNAIAPIKDDLPDHELYFSEFQSEFSFQAGMTLEYFLQVFAPYLGRPLLNCVSSQLNPRSRGTVTLQSTNPYDPPVIDPNYFEDPKDIQDIVEGLKACKRIGNHPIMRQFGLTPFRTLIPGCEQFAGNDDQYFTCSVRSMVITFSHQVGTARMGHPEDPRTVVDPQLRVLYVKGLRVVDASVMPIVPSGNTNVPTIMVAEKASDIIKSTIECYRDSEDQYKEMEEPGWYDRPQYYQQMPDSYVHGIKQPFGNKGIPSFMSGKISEFDSGVYLNQPSMDSENSDFFDSEWSDIEPKTILREKKDSKFLEVNPPVSVEDAVRTGKNGISSISDTVPWNQVIQLSTLDELTDALKNLSANKSSDSFKSIKFKDRSKRHLNQESHQSNFHNQRTNDQTKRNNVSLIKILNKQGSVKVTGWNAELYRKEVQKSSSSEQIPFFSNHKQQILLEAPHRIINTKNTQDSHSIHNQWNTERNDPKNINTPSKNDGWNGNNFKSVPWNKEIQELNISRALFRKSQNQNTPQSQTATKRQLLPQNWQIPMKKSINRPWNAELINNAPASSPLLNAKITLRPGALRQKTRALFPSKFSNTQQQISRPQLSMNNKNQLVSAAKLKTTPWNAELVNGKGLQFH